MPQFGEELARGIVEQHFQDATGHTADVEDHTGNVNDFAGVARCLSTDAKNAGQMGERHTSISESV